jgi:hypothetical protein
MDLGSVIASVVPDSLAITRPASPPASRRTSRHECPAQADPSLRFASGELKGKSARASKNLGLDWAISLDRTPSLRRSDSPERVPVRLTGVAEQAVKFRFARASGPSPFGAGGSDLDDWLTSRGPRSPRISRFADLGVLGDPPHRTRRPGGIPPGMSGRDSNLMGTVTSGIRARSPLRWANSLEWMFNPSRLPPPLHLQLHLPLISACGSGRSEAGSTREATNSSTGPRMISPPTTSMDRPRPGCRRPPSTVGTPPAQRRSARTRTRRIRISGIPKKGMIAMGPNPPPPIPAGKGMLSNTPITRPARTNGQTTTANTELPSPAFRPPDLRIPPSATEPRMNPVMAIIPPRIMIRMARIFPASRLRPSS